MRQRATIGRSATLQRTTTACIAARPSRWCRERASAAVLAPHTQAQNGVAERAWNTLVDAPATMLQAACPSPVESGPQACRGGPQHGPDVGQDGGIPPSGSRPGAGVQPLRPFGCAASSM